MAKLYYQYGRANALDESDIGYDLTSLQDMTILSGQGQWSPYYTDYLEYFKEDKWLDDAIMDAFDDDDTEALDQRRAYIVSLMKNNVVSEFMMGLLGLAIQVCQDSNNNIEPTLYWDGFAALYIGSLEGIDPAGSDDDGLLLWSLAANRARQFNTQNDNFGAKINDRMVDLLYAGQSQLERRDCTNFEKTASRVLHLMILPLIQSTIWYAIRNEKSANDEDLAVGEAMAYSVLPIVSKYDQTAASVIERNMIRVKNIEPVLEGPQVVANAFYKILDDISWGCEYVGQAEGKKIIPFATTFLCCYFIAGVTHTHISLLKLGVDTCENYDPNSSYSTVRPAVTLSAGLIFAMWVFALSC